MLVNLDLFFDVKHVPSSGSVVRLTVGLVGIGCMDTRSEPSCGRRSSTLMISVVVS